MGLAAKSGLWYFEGDSGVSIDVTVVPLLVGAEVRVVAFPRLLVTAQLFAGGSWTRVRSPDDDIQSPFDDALFKDTDLRPAGSAGVGVAVPLSHHLSVESGVTVDAVILESGDLAGFIGIPLGLVATF